MTNFRNLALLVGALLPAAFAAPTPAANQVIPGKFIVTLKQGASAEDVASHLNRVRDIHARSVSRRETVGVEKTYQIEDFNAYAGEFDDETIAAIKEDSSVSGYPGIEEMTRKD